MNKRNRLKVQSQYLKIQNIQKFLLMVFLLTCFLAGIWRYVDQYFKLGKTIQVVLCSLKQANYSRITHKKWRTTNGMVLIGLCKDEETKKNYNAFDQAHKVKSEDKFIDVKKNKLIAGNYISLLIFLASFFWEGIKYVYRVMSNPKYTEGIPDEEMKKILDNMSKRGIDQISHTITINDTPKTIAKKTNKDPTTVNFINTIIKNKKSHNTRDQS